MAQSPSPSVIEKQIRIAARPEVVYELLTDAGKLARWMAPEVVADARPGGVLRMNFNGFDIGRGEYVELVPAKRIVYTWGWETLGDQPPPGSTTVEMTLEPDGTGTKLTLIHRGLTGDAAKSHDEGWGQLLPGIEGAITGRSAAPTLDLSNGQTMASRLNTRLIELRYAIESASPSAWQSTTAAEGWTVAATARHAVTHAEAIVALGMLLQGHPDRLEAMATDRDQQNAREAERHRMIAADEVLRELCGTGPRAVDVVRGMSDADLARTHSFKVLGGTEMSIGTFLEQLAGTLYDHIDSVQRTLATRG